MSAHIFICLLLPQYPNSSQYLNISFPPQLVGDIASFLNVCVCVIVCVCAFLCTYNKILRKGS